MDDSDGEISAEDTKVVDRALKMHNFGVDISAEDTKVVDVPSEEDTVADDVDFDEVLTPTIVVKKSADILIEIDQDRKKVITLNDGRYDSLVEIFFEAVAGDPGLKEYADSTFVFQIFSQKFNTWIDLDRSKELVDGSHLKAIFLTQEKPETDIRHKHRKASKRRQADSSHNCSDMNCKCRNLRLSDGNIKAKRLCQPLKIGLSNAEKCGGTNMSVCNHDVIDFSEKPRKEQASELHSLMPVSQDELNRLSLSLAGKNPVSALHELCAKLHWDKPVFEIHEQDISLQVPKFLMKVTVMGHDYISDKFERKKQLAKNAAAECCLKELGVFK